MEPDKSNDRLVNYMKEASPSTLLLYISTRSSSIIRYILESFVQIIFSWIPTVIGILGRYLAYKLIFSSKSSSPIIEAFVEFYHANNITFGKSVYVDSNCRLHASIAEIDIGDNSRILRNSYLCTYVTNAKKGQGIYIGSKCWVGINSVISAGQGGIFIGDNVLIAPNVTIVTGNHDYTNTKVTSVEQEYSGNPIHINNNVWIGANAVIVGGVSIGEHAVVAAGSVVTRDVAAFTVVGGIPARDIKEFSAA